MYRVTLKIENTEAAFLFGGIGDAVNFFEAAANNAETCSWFDEPRDLKVTMEKVPEGGEPNAAHEIEQPDCNIESWKTQCGKMF